MTKRNEVRMSKRYLHSHAHYRFRIATMWNQPKHSSVDELEKVVHAHTYVCVCVCVCVTISWLGSFLSTWMKIMSRYG
jgi:hypothetical protein